MKRKILHLILLTVLCSFNLFAQKKEVALSAEEYRMLSNILDDSSLVISETTPLQISMSSKKEFDHINDDSIALGFLRKEIPELSDETVKDFNSKNKNSYIVERQFEPADKFRLISTSEINGIFSNSGNVIKGWENFKKVYPEYQGYNRFTRIGFSNEKKQAIIFLYHSCGSLCASADFIFYVKEKNNWIEKRKVNLWIS